MSHCPLKIKIDAALELSEYSSLTSCLGNIPNEQIMVAEPEDIIALITEYNPKNRLLAKLFVKQVFKNDLSPKDKHVNDQFLYLSYEGKCQSSVLKKLDDDYIYFDDIMKSLEDNAGTNLVYLNFSQCTLLENDLKIIVDILKAYKSIEAIDLESNRINLAGSQQFNNLDQIFKTKENVQINFNGNYCETDRTVLQYVYHSKNTALSRGYIWIYEAWLDGKGWVELLKQLELDEFAESIKASHEQFFATRNKYTKQQK